MLDALFSSFWLVALSEMGDKTQLLAFSLASRFRKPKEIMAGILVATIFNHALAASFGAWISSAVSAEVRNWILGITFIGFGIWTLKPDRFDDEIKPSRYGAFLTTTLLFFLAEMGDKTQLATVALAARHGTPVLVTIGTTIGMMFSDGLAVLAGERLADRIKMKYMRAIAASLFFLFGILCLINASHLTWAGVVSPWEKIKSPKSGISESIGDTSAGCLSGAEVLPIDGKGYQVMRLGRKRNFGHKRLITYLQSLGERFSTEHKSKVLFGDLGLPRGGPMMSGHRSHQIGLDADIWFWHPQFKKDRPLTKRERENLSAVSMTKPGRAEINPKTFGDRQIRLLKTAATSDEVDRIFVHAAIKKALCEKAANEPWISKVRPWYGHNYHFHVRLKCDPGNKACKNSEPVPAGNGCDETLAWWFTDEAKAKLLEAMSQKRVELPVLPEACAEVIKG